MKVHHQNNNKRGIFFIQEDGKKIAEMTYTWAGNARFIIDHTEVDPSQKGKGLGYLLVESAVHYARERTVKILPLCPFANAAIQKNKDYQDIL